MIWVFSYTSWSEPERAPRGHDVYCTCVRRRGLSGNECSLDSDGWLRTSADSFIHCMLAMNVKFALEQPSGTVVGLELARAAFMYVLCTIR